MTIEIHNKATVRNVAAAMVYLADVGVMSINAVADRVQKIEARMGELQNSINARIDGLIAHLSDDDAIEVLVAAVTQMQEINDERASKAQRRAYHRAYRESAHAALRDS